MFGLKGSDAIELELTKIYIITCFSPKMKLGSLILSFLLQNTPTLIIKQQRLPYPTIKRQWEV